MTAPGWLTWAPIVLCLYAGAAADLGHHWSVGAGLASVGWGLFVLWIAGRDDDGSS